MSFLNMLVRISTSSRATMARYTYFRNIMFFPPYRVKKPMYLELSR